MKKAWTEKDTFAFSGRFNQQRYVNIWPRPIQNDPHPPIWIPGGGSIETWRWCAEMDYVYCYLSYYGYKAGLTTMQGFWNEMEKLGKDRNPYRAGFLQFVGVAESRQQALDLYTEPAEYFYGRCLHVDPRFALPPGYTTEGDAARRHRGHDDQGRQPRQSGDQGGAQGDQHEGHRRRRLCHHRLARRGDRADPPCRRPASTSATSCCCCSTAT